MLVEGGKATDKRLGYGFELVTGRLASARELGVLRETLNAELGQYARHETGRRNWWRLARLRCEQGLIRASWRRGLRLPV